uniref:Uncharacterized protein n=1 Tax=Lutzomyia longipalpis TaxID=7200 RepID=A0A1B0CAK2_LUTLO
MERSQKYGDQSSDAIDDEVQKLLHSLDEDDRSIGADTANLMVNTPKMTSKPPSKSPSPIPLQVTPLFATIKILAKRRSSFGVEGAKNAEELNSL